MCQTTCSICYGSNQYWDGEEYVECPHNDDGESSYIDTIHKTEDDD